MSEVSFKRQTFEIRKKKKKGIIVYHITVLDTFSVSVNGGIGILLHVSRQ